jgi:hypothetical protein
MPAARGSTGVVLTSVGPTDPQARAVPEAIGRELERRDWCAAPEPGRRVLHRVVPGTLVEPSGGRPR